MSRNIDICQFHGIDGNAKCGDASSDSAQWWIYRYEAAASARTKPMWLTELMSAMKRPVVDSRA